MPLHSTVEALGAFAALYLAILLVLLGKYRQGLGHFVWVASALAGMGVLDLLHASVQPGNTFVWLRSTSTLIGGFLFALVWLPGSTRADEAGERFLRRLPVGVAVAATIFGALSIAFPDALPAMLQQDLFTPTAEALNLIGGLFFLAAAARFIIRYRTNTSTDARAYAYASASEFLFANLCLLFGAAGLLFPLSQKWEADWWFWHLLRLIAFLITLGYVFVIFRRSETELRAMNDALEQRARELARANQALQVEIAERKRAEETITRQAREIQEISTPVVQVWKGIVATTLIGTLDSRRTQQLMEVLLQRIVETQARVVILDITGVPLVDTAVANHLIKTVRAANLLGAHCLLVGIRPEIAQTIVHLGVDLSSLESYTDLQSGLERAFAMMGLGVEREA